MRPALSMARTVTAQRLAFRIGDQLGRAPCASAFVKACFDKRRIADLDLDGGQAHVVASRAVEAQHVAAQRPRIGQTQQVCIKRDCWISGIQREGDRIERRLDGAVPIGCFRHQCVYAFRHVWYRNGTLDVRDVLVLVEGVGVNHTVVQFDCYLLQRRRRLGYDRDRQVAVCGDIASLHR